jgi:selenocysteine lyase/cysteine desulfurase
MLFLHALSQEGKRSDQVKGCCHFFNTREDVDYLVDAQRRALKSL